jgi:hypothetical protein
MSLISDIENLITLISEKQRAIEAVSKQKDLIVHRYSPIKIGDIIDVNGYSFSGKKMVVDSIYFRPDRWRNTLFVAKGAVLKKDKTRGAHTGEHHYFDYIEANK